MLVCPSRFPDVPFPNWCLCALWYLFWPLIWIYHSVRIYVLQCCLSYAIGCCGQMWLKCGMLCCCFSCKCTRRIGCCICFRYEDSKHFPAGPRSIGAWNNKSEAEVAKAIEWRRGNDICSLGSEEHARLFSGKIEPSDIGQGQLGDCWLMTSLACLAEHPGAIQRVFLTDEYNPRGRYVLQLYNGQSREWEDVVVDDRIPVKAGTTSAIFAKPHGKELWVALLEKAFAKFVGSYHTLDGGHMLYGLQVLTGDEVSRWKLSNGSWDAYEIRYKKLNYNTVTINDRSDISFYQTVDGSGQQVGKSEQDFWEQLKSWKRSECVIAASTSGTDQGESTAQQGLVQGHAYSVLEVKECGDFRMLRLRNPWGSFEWTGAWSDASPLWEQHRSVRSGCGHEGVKADGMFWMEYGDFKKHFRNMDICHRSRGIRDVRLDIHEDDGCIGPTKGCCIGCGQYYCCCKGCWRLCCPTDHRHQVGPTNVVHPAPAHDIER